jgi:DNA helicase MCM9
MQETIGSVGVGSIPRSLLMVLVDDLTDSCKAGDDIIVTGNVEFVTKIYFFPGIVKRRWRWVNDGDRCDIEILLFANALRVSNEQRLGCNLTEETVSDFRRFWDKYRNRPLYGNKPAFFTWLKF